MVVITNYPNIKDISHRPIRTGKAINIRWNIHPIPPTKPPAAPAAASDKASLLDERLSLDKRLNIAPITAKTASIVSIVPITYPTN